MNITAKVIARRSLIFASVLSLCTQSCAWDRASFREPAQSVPVRRDEGSFSLISLNTWRLREVGRVPQIVQALQELERSLQQPEQPASIPDVLLFQELEGEQAIEQLRNALQPTHSFHVTVCARNQDGTTRSAVAIAASDQRFAAVSTTRIDLGVLWPDHPRCALAATMRDHHTNASITVVSVHLSARPANGPQAQRLVHELANAGLLDGRALVVGGDFNFSPTSAGYAALHLALHDPFERERHPTHWFSGRIDFTFLSSALESRLMLDPLRAFAITQPSDALSYPTDCTTHSPANCPVSDHLPVGGVYRLSP